MIWSMERSKQELKSGLFWLEVVAEGVATFFLIFFIVLLLITNNEEEYKKNTTTIGIAAGFLVTMLVEGFGPISGAHMNAAVSLSVFVVGHISPARVVAYIAIQFAGATAGAYIGYLVTPEDKCHTFHAFNPSPSMTVGQAIFCEGLMTFNLVFIAISCSDSESRTVTLPGVPVGFAIAIGVLCAGTHTGGVQNPVSAFAFAYLSGNFHLYYVYVIGPCVGGVLGACAYTLKQYIKNKLEPAAGAVYPGGEEDLRQAVQDHDYGPVGALLSYLTRPAGAILITRRSVTGRASVSGRASTSGKA